MVEPQSLLDAVVSGDRRALARAISIVEDRRPGAEALLAEAYAIESKPTVVGVTGAPGAGKSTLVSRSIEWVRSQERSVAVLAVDPSSPYTGGAVLGDRIRMQDHIDDPGVYVRSMSSRGRLGGLSDAVTRALVLLGATGVDVIIVETVGVGQSETEIAGAADTTVVVVTPGWGDAIQTAKAGLLEIADVFAVNKSDLGGADVTVADLTQMLEMGDHHVWQPPIVTLSARDGEGIDRLWDAIDRHGDHLDTATDRSRRVAEVIRRAVASELAHRVASIAIPDSLVSEVVERRIDPWAAARRLIS